MRFTTCNGCGAEVVLLPVLIGEAKPRMVAMDVGTKQTYLVTGPGASVYTAHMGYRRHQETCSRTPRSTPASEDLETDADDTMGKQDHEVAESLDETVAENIVAYPGAVDDGLET